VKLPAEHRERFAGPLYQISAVLAAIAGMGTVVGFLGDVWWVFALATAPRVHYALLFALTAGIFALLREWIALTLCVGGLVMNMSVILPLYLADPAPAELGSEPLDVMFLNVEFVGADPRAMIEDLRDGAFDLVFLAATNDTWTTALSGAPIPYSVVESRPLGVDLELLALARSDLQVTTTLHDFGEGGRDRAIEVMVDLGRTPVRVLAMHPVSPLTPDRARWNARQLETLASWAAIQEDPVLIVGDLNNTSWSFEFEVFTERGRLVNSQLGYGVQATWPARMGFLGIPIDHAVHSAELTTIDRSLGSGYGSEHRSLQVSVAPRAP